MKNTCALPKTAGPVRTDQTTDTRTPLTVQLYRSLPLGAAVMAHGARLGQ